MPIDQKMTDYVLYLDKGIDIFNRLVQFLIVEEKISKFMRALILAILVIFISLPVNAQNDLDSLTNLLPSAKGKSKVDILNTLSARYRGIDPDQSMKYATDAVKLARELNYYQGENSALRNIGVVHTIRSDYKAALKYFNESLEVAEKHGPPASLASSFNSIGGFYYLTGENQKALEYFDKAIQIALQENDNAGLINYYNNKGIIYSNIGIYNESLKYYFKSLELCEKMNDLSGTATAYHNIGTVYYDFKKPEKAYEFYERALKLTTKLNDIYKTSYLLNNMGQVKMDLNKYSEALTMHNDALKLQEKTGDQFGIANSLISIGKCLSKTGRYNEALEKQKNALQINRTIESREGELISLINLGLTLNEMKNFTEAIKYLKEALILAKNYNLKLEADTHLALSQAYERIGDSKNSLRYLKAYSVNRDSINSQDNINNLNQLQAEFEFAEQIKKIEILKKDNKIKELNAARQNATRNMLVLGLLSLILISGLLLFSNSKRKKLNEILHKRNKYLADIAVTKDKFLSSLSHDLRAPFHPLIGLSEILSEESETLSKDEIKKYAQDLNKLIITQYQLLEQLLDWSKIINNQVDFKPEIINLHELVNNVIGFTGALTAQKDITIRNKVPENMTIKADKFMLRSIMQNLLTNAIKFSNRNTEVIISANKNDRSTEVVVKDFGTGISTERIPTLFSSEKLFTSAGTEGEMGTGLGLILCKELIERHAGTISVKSKKNEGSEFKFTLPD